MDLTLYLQQSPCVFAGFVFLFTLAIGSFLNVVIYRLPVMLENEWREQANEFLALEQEEENQESTQSKHDTTDSTSTDNQVESQKTTESFNLAFPNSRCPSCEHEIKPWENIPVVSYLFLRGKCSKCKTKISLRYPAIEIVTACLSALVAYHFGFGWQAAAVLPLTWALVTLTMIDFDHQILPDNITLPLLWAGLLINVNGLFVPLSEAVIGGCAGYMTLWTVYWIFKIITGKEGMGYGDFKLLALLGAWMGWQALPLIILLSSLVGAIVGISMIVILGRDKNIPIPFGPYLSAAGFIALLWGDQIVNQYQQYLY
ncbi:MAG: prepilin peptidase [Gammaproteobacteria bacterium]|nr:MAG: prepilin peptidase [Gammaproteobacteria bacterium]